MIDNKKGKKVQQNMGNESMILGFGRAEPESESKDSPNPNPNPNLGKNFSQKKTVYQVCKANPQQAFYRK